MFAPKKRNMIKVNNHKFTISILADEFSRRAWVSDYAYTDPEEMFRLIIKICANYGLEKVIFPAVRENIEDLKTAGFGLEGWIDGYFSGKAAYFYALYPVSARSKSPRLSQYLRTIRQITEQPRQNPGRLSGDYSICTPTSKDIPALVEIFGQVFATYPSPVNQPDYLAAVMGRTALFKTAGRGSEVVSVAAAEVDWSRRNAELTNCATSPRHRGSGLMSRLIAELEEECLSKGINCLYSLARASSYGMNLVFHRLGYRYRGTLINNCHICGAYEDMNIWTKQVM